MTGCYYHVYNRGNNKQEIFYDDQDRFYFYQNMFIFNSDATKYKDTRVLRLATTRQGKPLARIVCYSFMPNHYHFLLEQLVDNGITEFMQRLGTSHTKYINERHGRSGSLFEGRFKAKLIDSDEYLLHLSRYIHTNPLDLYIPGWKDTKCRVDGDRFLKQYRWSSYPFYLGICKDPVVDSGLIKDMITSPIDYHSFMHEIELFPEM